MGGDGIYTYVWTGPNGFSLTETVGDIVGLCSGIYTLVVTDDSGDSSTITFTVSSPPAFNCTISSTDAITVGGNGTLYITVVGGAAPYFYQIDSGGIQGTIQPMPTSNISVNKPAGNYTVTITDGDGNSCSRSASIKEPAGISLNFAIGHSHTTCGQDNGTISVNSSSIGGVPPYTFNTIGPNGYSSQLTNLSSLESGTFNVQVFDSLGSSDVQTITINPSDITDTGCQIIITDPIDSTGGPR